MSDIASLRALAEETVLAMLYADEEDRLDVAASYALLPTVYSGRSGLLADGAVIFVAADEAQELIAKQKAAIKSLQIWKSRERTKTLAVGIVLCLNIGTDPPEGIRVAPYARQQCWIDPSDLPTSQAALDEIGTALKAQYERLQSKAKFKISLDPTYEDVQALAHSVRKNAKEDRVLFHYNGHGVPRPTSNGEIWVFNANYTQYVPMLVTELIGILGSPAFYVFDCSCAGSLLHYLGPQPPPIHRNSSVSSDLGASARSASVDRPNLPAHDYSVPVKGRDFFALAACGPTDVLPTHPDLPADVFTACLTTPIKMALHWAILRKGELLPPMYKHFIERIPGRLSERRTPLGELNWIFTSITDTIAWTTLNRPLFLRLFRQDLLCASLFRNFLLADRILRNYGCTPMSIPPLPPTHEHPLWATWDAAVEQLLNALPGLFGYSQFDIRRMTALELKPDLGHLDPEWNELVPPLKLKALMAAANGHEMTAAAPPTMAPQLTSSSAVQGVTRPRRTSTSTRKEPHGLTAATNPLLSWADTEGVDPLTLPTPSGASATAEQRVQMLRRRLHTLMPSTVVGAPTHAPNSESSPSTSTFFDEQLTSFENWLQSASYLPVKLNMKLGNVLLDFVQNAAGGFGGSLAYNLAANSAATYASMTAASAGGSDPLNLKSLAAVAAAVHLPKMSAALQTTQQKSMHHHPKGVTLPLSVPTSTGAPLMSRSLSSSSKHGRGGSDGAILANNIMMAAAAVGSLGGTSDSRAVLFAPTLRISAPDQLPVLLQVLLSQNQRLKALQLLAKFLDLGFEAVNLALVVGFHPYICKLLSSTSPELMPALVFVWAKVLALDRTSQVNLVNQGSVPVFVEYLQRMVDLHAKQRKQTQAHDKDEAARKRRRRQNPVSKKPSASPSPSDRGQPSVVTQPTETTPAAAATTEANATTPTQTDTNSALPEDQMTLAIFVLCKIMEQHPEGQAAAREAKLLPVLLRIVKEDQYSLNRQWAFLAIAQLLHQHEELRGKLVMQKIRATPNSVTLQVPAAANLDSTKSPSAAAEDTSPATSLGSDTLVRGVFCDDAPVRAAACSSLGTLLREDEAINVVQLSAPTPASNATDADNVGGASPSSSRRKQQAAAGQASMNNDTQIFRHAYDFFDARCKSILRQDAVPLSFVQAQPNAAAPTKATEAAPDDASVISNTTSLAGMRPIPTAAATTTNTSHPLHAASATVFSPIEIAALAVRECTADENSTHAYLRATWGFAFALYASGGALPIVIPQVTRIFRAEKEATAAKRARRIAILRLFANKVKRSLMPSYIVQRMRALQSAAGDPSMVAGVSNELMPTPIMTADASAPFSPFAFQSMSLLTPSMMPASFSVPSTLPSGGDIAGRKPSFTTEAPPADFLAEALAAAAAAEKQKQPGMMGMVMNDSGASLSSHGTSEMAPRGSHDNFNIFGSYSGLSDVPRQESIPVKLPPPLPPAPRPHTPPADVTQEVPQAEKIEERRAARRAARQKLVDLQSQFVATFSQCPRSLREVSYAVCLSSTCNDGCTAVRTEALLGLTKFAMHRTHEAAMSLVLAAMLVDFLNGGTRLSAIMKISADGQHAGGTLAAASTVDDGMAGVEAPLHPTSRSGMDAPTRQGFKFRLNFLNRLGNFRKEAPKPMPTVSEIPETKKTMPADAHGGARDASLLGLPTDVFSLSLLTQVLQFFATVYQQRCAAEDGALASSTASDDTTGDAFELLSNWMACGKHGPGDAVLALVSAHLGCRGLLYLAVSSSILAACLDADPHPSEIARSLVRRLMMRVGQTCLLQSRGKLPVSLNEPIPDASALAAVESPAEARHIGNLLKAQETYLASCLDLWDTTAGPSAGDMGLRSTLYDLSSAAFYQPILTPHIETEMKDSLSLANLQKLTRHKLLQSALFEANVLGATAYDDLTARFIIQAAGDLWTSLQAIQQASVYTDEQRQKYAIVQKKALYDHDASSADLLRQGLNATVGNKSFNAMLDAFKAEVPAASGAGTHGHTFYMTGDGKVVPVTMASAPIPVAGGMTSAPTPVVVAPTGSLIPAFGPPQELYASTFAGSVPAATTYMQPVGMFKGAPQAPQSLADVGSLVRPSSGALMPPDTLPAVSPALAPSTSTVTPAGPSANAPIPIQAKPPKPPLPPSQLSDPSAPRSLSGSYLQRRPSRFQSEYDGGGGQDARISAALLANDTSMLASSMGTYQDDESGMDADEFVNRGMAQARSSLAPIAERDGRTTSDVDTSQQVYEAMRKPLTVTTSTSNASFGTLPQQAFAATPAMAAAGFPVGPVPLVEEELDQQLRAISSTTPRLSPAFLARTRLGTIQYARASARKLAQKCLLDTGSPATSCVLFHPWADFLVVADQADNISTWGYHEGRMLDKFSNTSGGSCSPYHAFWMPSWTPILRQRVAATGRDVSGNALSSPFAAKIVGASASSARSAFVSRPGDGWNSDRSGKLSSHTTTAPSKPTESSVAPSMMDARELPTVHRRVTAMTWVNEHDSCHLLVGSDDGMVRIWDGSALAASTTGAAIPKRTRLRSTTSTAEAPPAATGAPPLVASFAALPELHNFPANTSGDAGADASAGLVLQWQPERSHLIVGGGRCPYVRIWDLQAERCIAQVPVNAVSGGVPLSSMHITCLSSAWPSSNVLIAGTSNGTVQVFDTRLGGAFGGASVMSLREHKRWVVGTVQAKCGSVYSLVTGSVNGDVKFWDIRRSASVETIQAHRAPMTTLAVHDYAPLMATGSRRQQVRIFTNSGQPMSDIRYHDGFLGQRIGQVSAVSFHPNRLLMAVGALDSIVSVYHGVPPLE